ncbi:hypothetical protein TWF718_007890 [Orbilia javanica]|uniref:DUF7918 domain-containing protein n=1 Tax=Orbilia javanica TaxID=47235 RepID=A0AAN8MW85_9PEZI
MPIHKGVTCELFVDGSKATEHHVSTEGEICRVWIVAEEGKPYKINVGATATSTGGPHHKIKFWADGIEIDACSLFSSSSATFEDVIVEAKARGKPSHAHCYLGSSASVSLENDSETIETRKEVIEKVGKLTISIWRCEYRLLKKKRSVTAHNPGLELAGDMNEKMLKGEPVSHCTVLGEATTARTTKTTMLKRKKDIDPIDRPLVTFTFNYSSKALLQALGYIPKTPSSEPIDHDLADLTHEQLQREIMRLRGKDADIKPNIKQEQNLQEAGTPKRKSPIHIDLTLDED